MGSLYAWASPTAISRFTLPQLLMYLKTEDGAPANAFRSPAEAQAYADALRKQKGLD